MDRFNQDWLNLSESEAWKMDSHNKALKEILFLHLVGWVYSLTRLPIKDIRRTVKSSGNKYATIVCDNDYEYEVDITGDSWSAMITDIARFVSIKF